MALAKINGQEVYFDDTGGEGPVLIFMHGFLMDHRLFDPQVDALKQNYRCIRWDSRAFGQTQWDRRPFSLYDSASDCLGLMDYLGIHSAILVGMSQGGYCGLRVALVAPHRIKGLVLMSTKACTDDEAVKAGYRQIRDTWVKLGPVDSLLEKLAGVLLGPKNAPGMERHWRDWIHRWKEIPGENIFHAMNHLLERDNIVDRLSGIHVPSLVTYGAEDAGLAAGEALSKGLPQCKGFVVVPNAMHAANLTHPEPINHAMLSFLDSLFYLKRPKVL